MMVALIVSPAEHNRRGRGERREYYGQLGGLGGFIFIGCSHQLPIRDVFNVAAERLAQAADLLA
jgi:hypothetical protein